MGYLIRSSVPDVLARRRPAVVASSTDKGDYEGGVFLPRVFIAEMCK